MNIIAKSQFENLIFYKILLGRFHALTGQLLYKLGKPRILSFLPYSFKKIIKHEHSCKIFYLFVLLLFFKVSMSFVSFWSVIRALASHTYLVFGTQLTGDQHSFDSINNLTMNCLLSKREKKLIES